MERVFFDSWSVLIRTAVVGVLAYAMLIVFLRISGKRTLSKMRRSIRRRRRAINRGLAARRPP
jgi:hypothetical protein